VEIPDPRGVLPFEPRRAHLYSQSELTARTPSGLTVDETIGAWFHDGGQGVDHAFARAVHDASIDVALAAHVVGHRVVGVMGGHGDARGSATYTAIARLGRALTRAGFRVATGGGPGLMEAANLGAWFAPAPDADLDAALDVLRTAPSYDADRVAYVEVADMVRDRWPTGGESLGVPTWVYADEPTSAFCTHIAKYFTNSIREDGLLALARSGVVYAPGGAGTVQEIFTDAAQNTNTLYEVRSPMVFVSRPFYEAAQPELVRAVQRQAERYGWAHLVTVVDDVDEVLAFVARHDPDRTGAASLARGRRRPEPA
jgi:predicted Rossmann-fold nucleotide-binding protein